MHVDLAVARVAANQRGLITRAQLADLGLGRGAIAHRVQTGRLHRVYRGVFGVGTSSLMPLASELGAVLAVGEVAVLSHWSAAYVWELVGRRERDVDVSITTRSGRTVEGIRIHRPTDPIQTTKHKGIPITTPAQTIEDLARTEPTNLLERATNEARARGLLTPRDLAFLADGRSKTLRQLLTEERGFTRSEAERRLKQLVRKAGLPAPIPNAVVEGRERDFVWPKQRLVVEFDSWAHHGTRTAFETDRRRDHELTAAGWKILRITWRQLTDEPEYVVATLALALAR